MLSQSSGGNRRDTGERRIRVSRGRMLGGSGAINTPELRRARLAQARASIFGDAGRRRRYLAR